MRRVLVAGIGNVLLQDDGFGVEAARRLASLDLPPGVEVMDAGIRSLHLAYRLLEGYDLLLAIDAVYRGGAPGTLYLLEPGAIPAAAAAAPGAHGMDLASTLGMLDALGGRIGGVLVLGCEPAALGEGIGLSPVVERAVEEAVRKVQEIVGEGGQR